MTPKVIGFFQLFKSFVSVRMEFASLSVPLNTQYDVSYFVGLLRMLLVRFYFNIQVISLRESLSVAHTRFSTGIRSLTYDGHWGIINWVVIPILMDILKHLVWDPTCAGQSLEKTSGCRLLTGYRTTYTFDVLVVREWMFSWTNSPWDIVPQFSQEKTT